MSAKTTTKVATITKDRYEQADHYRAQVQVDKLIYAVCYGSIFNRDMREAGRLRDALAEAIERVILEHFRALIVQPEFRWYFNKWKNENVAEDMRAEVESFLRKNFGI